MEKDKHLKMQKYLDNLLSEEESVAFEKELNSDKQIQLDFELLKDIEQELGNNELMEFKKKLSGTMEQPIRANSAKKENGLSFSRQILAFAASFLVIGIASWWIYAGSMTTDSDNYLLLVDEYFIHYPAQEIARGADKAEPIYENYNAKNYNVAASELEKYAQENSDDNALLMAAIAYLANDDSMKAIALLQKMPDTPYLINKKNYYLALSYLQQGQKTTALSTLQNINKADKYLYDQAQDLLTKLQ